MRTLLIASAAALLATTALLPVPAVLAQASSPALAFGQAKGSGPVLQPFAASNDDLLFTGESERRTLIFVAQPEQLGGGTNLVLNLQSAISDAPESSHLGITLNDRDLGTLQLKSGEPYTVRLQVPPGVIQPGYNALQLTADQAHRVDCSVQATYELWTKVDPVLSGIEYETTSPAQNSFQSVLALARANGGSTSIHGLIAPATTGDERDQLLKAIQAVSIAAAFDRPKVTFSDRLAGAQGLDVVVGSLRKVTDLLQGRIDAGLHSGINIVHDVTTGGVILAVTGETSGDLDRQIADLSRYASQFDAGAPQGVAAVSTLRGAPIDSNQKVTFSTLGLDDRIFNGRYFHQSMQLRMPTDFYPADYARAGIHLDALYARGLTQGAQLLVKLNGQTVSTVLLSGSRTGEIKNQILPISLTAFRPGLNDLTIEASLPTEADATCDPAHIADGGGRLRISGSSYIEMPELARIGRSPDLASLDRSIMGRQPADSVLDVAIDSNDGSLNAAGTFLARLAYLSNRVINTSLVSSGQYDPATPTLAFASLDALSPDFANRLNINPAGAMDLDAAPVVPPADASTADAAPALSWDEQARLVLWRAGDYAQDQSLQIVRDVRVALYGLGSSFGLNVDLLRPDGDQAFTPQADTALLLAQRSNGTSDIPLTLVASAKAADLEPAVDRLSDGAVWNRLAGSTMTLSATGDVLQSVPARDAQLFLTEPPTLSNGRLIAAGWLSNNPAVYVILMFLFALFLGISTSLVLWRGRKNT